MEIKSSVIIVFELLVHQKVKKVHPPELYPELYNIPEIIINKVKILLILVTQKKYTNSIYTRIIIQAYYLEL